MFKNMFIVLLVIFVGLLMAVPAFAAPAIQDAPEVEEVPVVAVESAEVDEPVEDFDLDAVSGSLGQIVILVVIAALFVLTNEAAFENFIAVPIIEQYLPSMKKWQPFGVVALAIALIQFANIDLLQGLSALTEYVQAPTGDAGVVGTGLLVGLLSMWQHDRKQTGSLTSRTAG